MGTPAGQDLRGGAPIGFLTFKSSFNSGKCLLPFATTILNVQVVQAMGSPKLSRLLLDFQVGQTSVTMTRVGEACCCYACLLSLALLLLSFYFSSYQLPSRASHNARLTTIDR